MSFDGRRLQIVGSANKSSDFNTVCFLYKTEDPITEVLTDGYFTSGSESIYTGNFLSKDNNGATIIITAQDDSETGIFETHIRRIVYDVNADPSLIVRPINTGNGEDDAGSETPNGTTTERFDPRRMQLVGANTRRKYDGEFKPTLVGSNVHWIYTNPQHSILDILATDGSYWSLDFTAGDVLEEIGKQDIVNQMKSGDLIQIRAEVSTGGSTVAYLRTVNKAVDGTITFSPVDLDTIGTVTTARWKVENIQMVGASVGVYESNRDSIRTPKEYRTVNREFLYRSEVGETVQNVLSNGYFDLLRSDGSGEIDATKRSYIAGNMKTGDLMTIRITDVPDEVFLRRIVVDDSTLEVTLEPDVDTTTNPNP